MKFIIFLSLIIFWSNNVYAYIGPGLGIGLIASIIGLIVSIFIFIFAILWIPFKKIFYKNKKKPNENNTS